MRGNLLDLLDVDEAENELAQIQLSGDFKRYSDFMRSEGHRIFRARKYDKRAPLWIFIEVYQIDRKDIELFFDIVKNFDLFTDNTPNEASSSIITYLMKANYVLEHTEDYSNHIINKTKILAPYALSELYNMEVDIDVAIEAFERVGFKLKNPIKGLDINTIRNKKNVNLTSKMDDLPHQDIDTAKQTAAQEFPQANIKTKRKKPVSQLLMAKLADVDVRTIRNWEKGSAPHDYPGRYDRATCTEWAASYKKFKSINRALRVAGANRPVSGVDMDNLPAEDDES